MSSTLQRARRNVEVIVGGRYGLGSKDFTPAMAAAVFANLASQQPKDSFVVRRPAGTNAAANRGGTAFAMA